MRKVYAIVTGDLVQQGGMDRPNYELAWYLAEQAGAEVHLVSHRVNPPLSDHPNVIWHRVPRPFGRHAIGSPLLSLRGRQVAREVSRAGGTVIVNGGNCLWDDVNWIHYVHNVPSIGRPGGSFIQRQWARWNRLRDRRREKWAVSHARLIITDSDLAKACLVTGVSIDPDRVRTIYYGIDPEIFHPPEASERSDARGSLGLPPNRPLVAFIGALGSDRRKGFDILFDAWEHCLADGNWDAVLVVAGTGSELAYWKQRVAKSGREDSIRMLGFTKEVPTLLAAADLLVSPTRFEPYGQGVHEAICCGLPAFVTRCAGVSERYPANLYDLLLDDPPDALQLYNSLKKWSKDIDGYRHRVISFGEELRCRTWSDMAAEFVQAIREVDQTSPQSRRRVTN